MAELFSPKNLSPSASNLSPAAELDQAWRDRLEDARALLAAGRAAASMTSAIYALEIRLKVKICEKLDIDALPHAFEFHELSGLLTLSGLHKKMEAEHDAKSATSESWEELVVVSKSLNRLRYRPASRSSIHEAASCLDWLENPAHGVLTWLSTH